MENKLKAIDDFYVSCMNCPNTEKECKGIKKDIANGVPPRGFYFKEAPVKILVVSKNPGHPLEGQEEELMGNDGLNLYRAYREQQGRIYYNLGKTKDKSLKFHKNLFRYLSFFLDIDNNMDYLDFGAINFDRIDLDSLYKEMAHTNLVKCSTVEEQGRLDKSTIEKCFYKFFLEEIRLFQPKILLALGGEVASFLIKMQKTHNLPPIIRIKHPSYFYKKENEKEKLTEIKQQIWMYLS